VIGESYGGGGSWFIQRGDEVVETRIVEAEGLLHVYTKSDGCEVFMQGA